MGDEVDYGLGGMRMDRRVQNTLTRMGKRLRRFGGIGTEM